MHAVPTRTVELSYLYRQYISWRMHSRSGAEPLHSLNTEIRLSLSPPSKNVQMKINRLMFRCLELDLTWNELSDFG